MLETRLINDGQLNEALHHHWTTGQRLGEAVVSLGFAPEEDIQRLLKVQPAYPREFSETRKERFL